MSMDAGGLAHLTYNGLSADNRFETTTASGYGSRGKAQHIKRLSVAPHPSMNSINEDQVDANPTPRTSRGHLLAGLRTAPKQTGTVPASAPYGQQQFNPDAASFAGRNNPRGGFNAPQTATASHFPQHTTNAYNGYGYQNMYSGSEQVLAPPQLSHEQMDPELYNTLMAQKLYLQQRQQQLQQQLYNVTSAAQQFQGMNLNNGHHAPATPITPQSGMYGQQVQSGIQPIVQPTSQPGVYTVYNPLTGQQTLYYGQDVMSPIMSPTQTPGLSISPDPEQNRFSFSRKTTGSPPFGQGFNTHRTHSPPKGTPSPSQDVAPLPPPSANAFRPGHRKSMSLAPSLSKVSAVEGPKSADPRSSAFPFTPRVGTFGPGLARAGEHPTRQPRGPPPMDELMAAPTSQHDGSKNFASRQRRRAVHDLVRAGKERRSGRNGSTDSSAGTPSSESEINFVISSDADSEGASSATTGSGSLTGDPTFGNLKVDKAIGHEWKGLKDRAHDSGSFFSKSGHLAIAGTRDFATVVKSEDLQATNSVERRKSPLLVLASAAEKRKRNNTGVLGVFRLGLETQTFIYSLNGMNWGGTIRQLPNPSREVGRRIREDHFRKHRAVPYVVDGETLSLDQLMMGDATGLEQSHGTRNFDYPLEDTNKSTVPSFLARSAGSEKTDQGAAVSELPLETYLPLGSLSVTLSSEQHALISNESVEVVNFLPDAQLSSSLKQALTLLCRAGWLRVTRLPCSSGATRETWRLYLLPDDAARMVFDRSKTALRKHLDEVLQAIDVSPEAWFHTSRLEGHRSFSRWPSADRNSLFYLFNTLPSPDPSAEQVKDRYSRFAMRSLLDHNEDITGLRATLYPYQRRSAAEMLRRESAPQMELDPRLEERTGPTGDTFYYNGRDKMFMRHPRFYDSVRGGILAETMGLGKTVICIALVLATKGHWPSVPPQHAANRVPKRAEVGTLLSMTAATLSRHPIPWTKYFDDIRDRDGLDMANCRTVMEQQVLCYEITPAFIRSHRHSDFSSRSEVVRLCSGTLIVVPRNLVHQWESELAKHVEDGALQVLVLADKNKHTPSHEELVKYDIVLFSRPRFENEIRNTDELYESPLKRLHWLRIIIDEGHSISTSNSNAAIVAEKLVRAERRWIVSGTPAKDLIGVEVDLAAMTNTSDTAFQRNSLEQRKAFNVHQEESSGAIKALGTLASRFLKAQPWAASPASGIANDTARWEEYICRRESLFTKTYTGFSTCLRRTLEGLVVKTRPEDVERDIELPPLTHKVVRLEPSFYDKLTANLFVLLILSNAVTSERQDMDYLFHKNSQHHLHRLISSLRQSAFYWTGLDELSVRASLDVTVKYLAKEDSLCSEEDRKSLTATADAARIALASPLWRAVTQASEMGIFAKEWPEESKRAWAFADCQDPMALGLTHGYEAQKFINERLKSGGPTEGFAAAAEETKRALSDMEDSGKQGPGPSAEMTVPSPVTMPVHNTEHWSNGAENLPASEIANFNSLKKSPRKASAAKAAKASLYGKQARKKRRLENANADIELSAESDLGRAVIIGTNSSKLSYLIDCILALYKSEKILIFYDASYVGYYLATALDLFHIKYLMYASDISNEQRGKYLVLFNRDASQRVMLMDIKQAAHGLNVCAASRIFIINPVCRPDIVAQAIKRVHRIGQTRPVFVETLLLRGTIEEAIYERTARMTSHEHLQAKTIEDDLGVARIIQSARILPIAPEEMSGEGMIAKLKVPQQIFGRPGRGGNEENLLEKAVFGDEEGDGGDDRENKAKKRKGTAKGKEVHSRKGQRDGKAKPEGTMVVVKEEPLSDDEHSLGAPQMEQSRSSSSAAPAARSSLFGGSTWEQV